MLSVTGDRSFQPVWRIGFSIEARDNFVLAYMRLSLSARNIAGSGSEAVRHRDLVAARMSSSQIADAKKPVQNW